MRAPDTILCDLDGVVWLAGRPIPGSVDAVHRMRDAGLRLVFVTNSSAPTIAEHTATLAAVGIEATGDVVSSATAASQLLRAGERVLVCGGAGVREAVEMAGAVAVAGDDEGDASNGVDAVVVGLHQNFDYRRLRIASTAIRNGARFIACNRDPLYPTPDGPIPGGGTIVAAVATAVGFEPEVAGKPHLPAAHAVAATLGTTLDDPALADRLVMVGDMLSTDALFAERLGCRFALVRTGNTPAGAAVAIDLDYDVADLREFASTVLAVS